MRQFLLDAFLKPGIAILFLLGFGLPFLFFGFQSIEMHGIRETDDTATFTLKRKHFWGIVKFERTIAEVERAKTIASDDGTGTHRQLLQSAVLVAGSEEIPLFMGTSSADDDLNKRLVSEVNAFIQNSSNLQYTGTFGMRNVFGWVAIPFAAIGLLGLFRWPYTIISKWRDHRKMQ